MICVLNIFDEIGFVYGETKYASELVSNHFSSFSLIIFQKVK